jgi:hypothetical protein
MHDSTLDKQFKEKSRVTPYDTGKIKIGVYYEPPRPSQDEDELALQDALLGGEWRPAASAKTNWQMVALVVGGILVYIFGVSLVLR